MPITTKFTGNLTSPYAARLIGNVARESYARLADDTLLPALRTDLPGHFGKTVKKKITGQGLAVQMTIFSNADGIKQIEEGRPANQTPPPVRAILKWVKRKNIGAKALSIKTRKPLSVGIKRIRERKTGSLRSAAKSLQAKQLGIAIAISKRIGKEGLPRQTGFPPSHNLRLFETLKEDHATEINAALALMQSKIADILNA